MIKGIITVKYFITPLEIREELNSPMNLTKKKWTLDKPEDSLIMVFMVKAPAFPVSAEN